MTPPGPGLKRWSLLVSLASTFEKAVGGSAVALFIFVLLLPLVFLLWFLIGHWRIGTGLQAIARALGGQPVVTAPTSKATSLMFLVWGGALLLFLLWAFLLRPLF